MTARTVTLSVRKMKGYDNMNKRKIIALLIAAMFITGTAAVCHAQDTAVISAQTCRQCKNQDEHRNGENRER